MQDALSKAAEAALSVTELTERIRVALEGGFAEVWVRGEVSNVRRQSSGHLYFTLKDAGAQLSAVAFRQTAMRMPLGLKDGQEVRVFGRLSVFPPRGSYQLVVQVLIEEGLGKLQARFESLKRQLAEEGLFAPERKKPLPTLPRVVGFVTSPTGAALQDFISILRRRGWNGTVRVFPARVQGQGAAEEITRMIQLADAQAACELLVVGRGGGSLEDLWPFNEEIVVRAVAACSLPTISAVGHEIDFALTDFAADRRAETPSAAAELISSAFVRQRERLGQLEERLERRVERVQDRLSVRLERLRHRLAQQAPARKVELGWLRLDDLNNRLHAIVERRQTGKSQRLDYFKRRLREVHPVLALRLARQRVEHLQHRLSAANPKAVLQRGYALVSDEKGRLVTDVASIKVHQNLTLQMRDGSVHIRRMVKAQQTELELG